MAGVTLQHLLVRVEAALEEAWGEVVVMPPMALNLPATAFLRRRLDLPLLPRLSLARLMRFEALRHIPLPPERVRCDYRIISRDFSAARLTVELVIIRAEDVPPGTEAVRISDSWVSRRLAGQGWREVVQNPRLQRRALRFAVPAVLALAAVLAAQGWSARLAAARDADVVAARAQAGDVEPVRARLLALNDSLTFLAAQRAQPSATQTAEDIARLLPDDAWLQELDIEPGTIRLTGTARHATDLLRVFSGTKLFSAPSFAAPLTPSPDGAGSAFTLVMSRS